MLGVRNTYSFKRETYNLAIILFFFELDFGLRFVWDKFIYSAALDDKETFGFALGFQLVCLVDALSFSALLMFHYMNFKE